MGCAAIEPACGQGFQQYLSLNEFPQSPFGNILAGEGGHASVHDNRFVQNESVLLGVYAGGFDLSAFGVTTLLFWRGKSGVAIGGRSDHYVSYRPFFP